MLRVRLLRRFASKSLRNQLNWSVNYGTTEILLPALSVAGAFALSSLSN